MVNRPTLLLKLKLDLRHFLALNHYDCLNQTRKNSLHYFLFEIFIRKNFACILANVFVTDRQSLSLK